MSRRAKTALGGSRRVVLGAVFVSASTGVLAFLVVNAYAAALSLERHVEESRAT